MPVKDFENKHRLKFACAKRDDFNIVAIPPYVDAEKEVEGANAKALVDAGQLVHWLADMEYGFINRKAVRAQDVDENIVYPDDVDKKVTAILGGNSDLGITLNVLMASRAEAVKAGDGKSVNYAQLCLIEDQQRGVAIVIGDEPLKFGGNNQLKYVDITQPDGVKKVDDFIGGCVEHRYSMKSLKVFREGQKTLRSQLLQAYLMLAPQPDDRRYDYDAPDVNTHLGEASVGSFLADSYKNISSQESHTKKIIDRNRAAAAAPSKP